MHEHAVRRPQTQGELRSIGGIGEAKAARYGVALIELLKR
ncbi:MAG: HRDC domain-containing protein [Proteobacteria bacterium]|nr:HRDC domain-containing protein [Pseudomonadota bacterium]